MAFKIKDLMVNVLPPGLPCLEFRITNCGGTGAGTATGVRGCGGCSVCTAYTCTGTFGPTGEFACVTVPRTGEAGLEILSALTVYPQCIRHSGLLNYPRCFHHSGLPAESWQTALSALSSLRNQLLQQLAEVEERQAAAEANLQPQTVEDVDRLTQKINDALDELKARRAELSRKPVPSGD